MPYLCVFNHCTNFYTITQLIVCAHKAHTSLERFCHFLQNLYTFQIKPTPIPIGNYLSTDILVVVMAPDPRRAERVVRYSKEDVESSASAEGVNAIGMICSLVGLLVKVSYI